MSYIHPSIDIVNFGCLVLIVRLSGILRPYLKAFSASYCMCVGWSNRPELVIVETSPWGLIDHGST